MKTLNERKSILDEEVLKLTVKGWTVKSSTDTTCTLIKKDNLAWLRSLFLILNFIPSMGEGIKTRIVEVTPEGTIKHSRVS